MSNIPVGTYIKAFNENTFTKDFLDKDGDLPCEVVIMSLTNPLMGKLFFNNEEVIVGLTFNYKESTKLSYLRISSDEITDSFQFKISDNNQNKLYSNMAVVNISIGAYVNLKPDEVGDLTVSMTHGATKVFTVNDFTVGLIPPYHDPEGDAPSKLKVLSLPESGLLKLNGVNVIINQEIPFSQIASGFFIYVADGTVLTAISTDFDFSISDTGSGLFTS
jgi:hypothetical protein